VVEAAARLVSIDSVIAATPEVDGETVLASVVRPIPYGEGKVHGLRARMGSAPLLAAFGDNAFDVAMLKEARVPVAVRPKARLAERVHEVPGLVVIERR
jgi:phosphoserine phosphatase